MSKWECPTQEDIEVILANGIDPNHCAVSRPGENQLVILNWLEHRTEYREIYVRLPEKVKSPSAWKNAAHRKENKEANQQ